MKPSSQRGGIGHAIGILDDRRRGFPGTAFHEVAQQCLAACDEAVVAVGRREGRQEREGLVTAIADATANPDPIVMFVMRLFAAAAMADDRVLGADRATAQDDFRGCLGPIGFEVVLRGRKWDKQNRSNEGFARPLTLPKIDGLARGPSSLNNKSQLERE